jgi:hypothetical protein
MPRWPYPGDTQLDIARRIAGVYREHLHTANRAVCDALDAAMRAYGQLWMFPQPVLVDDTDAITTAQAAALVSRSQAAIRRWAATAHPTIPGRALLPRFGWDGKSRTYLAGEVRAAAYLVATRTAPATDPTA